MNAPRTVVLQKIPIDATHIDALRVGRVRPSHLESQMPAIDGTLVPRAFRIAAFALFIAFLVNPIAVAYAQEVDPLPPLPDPASTEAAPTAPEPGVTVVIPPSTDDVIEQPTSSGEADPTAPTVSVTGGESDLSSDVQNTQNGSTDNGATGNEPSSGITQDNGATGDGETGGLSTSTDATTTEETVQEVGGGGAGSTDASSTPELGDATSTDATTTDILAEDATLTDEAQDATTTDPATNLERAQTPEEYAAERQAALEAMREQIRKEVVAEMRSKCVSYGDDGYYCLDETSEKKLSTEAPVEQVVSSAEGGGDKEIVLVRTLPEGETREMITNNDTDDEFPSADGSMRMVVWQTLVDGRWQIAYKDLAGSDSAQYLTSDSDGNGHPATDGRRIVWQHWSGDNWDIYLAEPASSTPLFAQESLTNFPVHPGWSVRVLSENPDHDMFPKIAGNMVTWQEHQGEKWVIAVYDLATGEIKRVAQDTGGEAPSLALIYTERTKEGRVFVRAQDIATGQSIPLGDKENPEPSKLPIPEQNGALPNNASTSTSSVRPEGDTEPDAGV